MFLISTNGMLEWGPGTTDQEFRLERNVANQLTLTKATFAVAQQDDDYPRIALKYDGATGGEIHLGPGGENDPMDVILYRSAADTLRTPDKLIVDDKVGIGTTSVNNVLTVVQNSATDPIADDWTTYSSRRWKLNISPIRDALQKILRLQGVSYERKADGRKQIGLVAEEVGEVVPEVVAYEVNGTDARSIEYSRLVAILIEAVKEQQLQIDQLRQAPLAALRKQS